jgi:hypothetical protein
VLLDYFFKNLNLDALTKENLSFLYPSQMLNKLYFEKTFILALNQKLLLPQDLGGN